MLALSFHSVIEGIAFGVMEGAASVSMLFATVMVHKAIMAFSVGLQVHFAMMHWNE